MPSLSDRLGDYAALPPDERAAVARDVAASGGPGDAERLADARAFAALLDAAGPARPVTPDDVADYVADRALGLTPADADRVEAALATDAGLRAHADRLEVRAARLHEPRVPNGTETPDALFARLTGLALPGTGPPETAADAAQEPAAATAVRRASDRQGDRARDRAAAAPPRQRARAGRRVLVLAAAVLVAYGGLAVVSSAQQTDRARLTELGDLDAYAPMQVRGTETDTLADRLDRSLDGVAGARRSWLGLFPRYDAAALDGVAERLAAVIAAAPREASVSQEARLALARIRLYQERDAEAVRLLGALVREQSYRAADARRLLDSVRADTPS